MGIWEYISTTSEAVKRNAPDVTPLNRACRTSYDYGSAAFVKIDQAVRINVFSGLTKWMPDKENIGLYSSKFAKNAGAYALEEGYKLIPGGVAFSKILTNTVNDVKRENLRVEKLKELEEEIGPRKKHSNGGRKLFDGAQMHSREGKELASSETGYLFSTGNKTPEDVIRVFMMKEFIGNRFLEDLMVPKVTRRKKPANKAE